MSHGERLDPPENPRLDALWESHLATCENCIALDRDGHLGKCSECDHAWHKYACKDESGCECEEDGGLSDRQIEDLQIRCFNEEQEALRDNYDEYEWEPPGWDNYEGL